MASAPVIECPLTPEQVEHCPVTPEGRPDDNDARTQSPNSAPSSDGSSERQSAGSPPPNCAICLGRCVNKCFTDNCMHKFCFSCLMEWSKIKAECPLCKKPFRSIIHNVKSSSQFDEYIVNQPARPRPQPRLHRLNVILSDRPRFRYRTTFQVNPNESEAIQQLFLHQSQELRSDPGYFDQLLTRNMHSRSRRQVYDSRMFAQPLFDINGRDRICSAEFYRENPAQVHRLVPWISREILALTNNISYRAEFLIAMIHEMLTQHDITSPQFHDAVEPHLLDRTRHFIHELNTFARSPYDMYGYDRYVRYSAPVEESVVISTEESSDGEDNVSFLTRRGRTEFTIETRSNVSTVILTGSFRCPTSSGNSSNNVGVIDISNDSGTTTANVAGSSSSSGLNSTETINIIDDGNTTAERPISYVESLTDTDSDECMFVREQKPPHLRTPEYIELNSADEDSDVVFVDNNVDNNLSLPPKKRRIEPIPPSDETQVNANVASTSTAPVVMKTETESGPPQMKSEKISTQPNEPLPSTSKGTNDGHKLRRKYYAEPFRRHNRMLRHTTRIFDASSSSSSSSSSSKGTLYSSSDSSSPIPTHPKSKTTGLHQSPPSPTPSNSSTTSSSSHEEFKVYTSARRKKRNHPKRKSQPPKTLRTKKRKLSRTAPPQSSSHRKKDKYRYQKTINLNSVVHKKYETATQEISEATENGGDVGGVEEANINCDDVTPALIIQAETTNFTSNNAVKAETPNESVSVSVTSVTSSNNGAPIITSNGFESIPINNQINSNPNEAYSDSSNYSSSSSPPLIANRSSHKRNRHSFTNVYISSHFNKSSTSSSSSSSSTSSSSSSDSDF